MCKVNLICTVQSITGIIMEECQPQKHKMPSRKGWEQSVKIFMTLVKTVRQALFGITLTGIRNTGPGFCSKGEREGSNSDQSKAKLRSMAGSQWTELLRGQGNSLLWWSNRIVAKGKLGWLAIMWRMVEYRNLIRLSKVIRYGRWRSLAKPTWQESC